MAWLTPSRDDVAKRERLGGKVTVMRILRHVNADGNEKGDSLAKNWSVPTHNI